MVVRSTAPGPVCRTSCQDTDRHNCYAKCHENESQPKVQATNLESSTRDSVKILQRVFKGLQSLQSQRPKDHLLSAIWPVSWPRFNGCKFSFHKYLHSLVIRLHSVVNLTCTPFIGLIVVLAIFKGGYTSSLVSNSVNI